MFQHARKQAIEEALAKAPAFCPIPGMKLGKLKGFSEGGDYIPPMPYTRGIGGGVAMDAAEKRSTSRRGAGSEGECEFELRAEIILCRGQGMPCPLLFDTHGFPLM